MAQTCSIGIIMEESFPGLCYRVKPFMFNRNLDVVYYFLDEEMIAGCPRVISLNFKHGVIGFVETL